MVRAGKHKNKIGMFFFLLCLLLHRRVFVYTLMDTVSLIYDAALWPILNVGYPYTIASI